MKVGCLDGQSDHQLMGVMGDFAALAVDANELFDNLSKGT